MLLETIEKFCQDLDVGLLIWTAHEDVVYVACHSRDPLQYGVHDLLEDSLRMPLRMGGDCKCRALNAYSLSGKAFTHPLVATIGQLTPNEPAGSMPEIVLVCSSLECLLVCFITCLDDHLIPSFCFSCFLVHVCLLVSVIASILMWSAHDLMACLIIHLFMCVH